MTQEDLISVIIADHREVESAFLATSVLSR